MTKISPLALSTVTGGSTSRSTSSNDQITQQLTALQSSIKDVAGAPKQDNSMMMMVMMMMMNRPQTNVVAAGGPPPVAVAAAPGPVVNIATRVR